MPPVTTRAGISYKDVTTGKRKEIEATIAALKAKHAKIAREAAAKAARDAAAKEAATKKASEMAEREATAKAARKAAAQEAAAQEAAAQEAAAKTTRKAAAQEAAVKAARKNTLLELKDAQLDVMRRSAAPVPGGCCPVCNLILGPSPTLGSGFAVCETAECDASGMVFSLSKAGKANAGKTANLKPDGAAAKAKTQPPVCVVSTCGKPLTVMTIIEGPTMYKCSNDQCLLGGLGAMTGDKLGEVSAKLIKLTAQNAPRRFGLPPSRARGSAATDGHARPPVGADAAGDSSDDGASVVSLGGSSLGDSDSSVDEPNSKRLKTAAGESATRGSTGGGKRDAAGGGGALGPSAAAVLEQYGQPGSKGSRALVREALKAAGSGGDLGAHITVATWKPAAEMRAPPAISRPLTQALETIARSPQALSLRALDNGIYGIGLGALAPLHAVAGETSAAHLATTAVGADPAVKDRVAARLQEPGIGMLSGMTCSPLAAAITASPDTGVGSTGLSTLIDTGAFISTMSRQGLLTHVGDICTQAVLIEFNVRRETAPGGGDAHSSLTAKALGWDGRVQRFKVADQVVALAEQVVRDASGPMPLGLVVQLILAASITTGHLAFLPEGSAGQQTPAFSKLMAQLAGAVHLTLINKGCILGAPDGVAPSSVRSAMLAAANGSGGAGPRKAVSIAAAAPSSPTRPPRDPTPHPTPKSAAIARLDQELRELRGSVKAAAAAAAAAPARRSPPSEQDDERNERRREQDGQQSGRRRERDGQPRRERKDNDGICDHFQKPGGCKFGASCRFRHVKRQ